MEQFGDRGSQEDVDCSAKKHPRSNGPGGCRQTQILRHRQAVEDIGRLASQARRRVPPYLGPSQDRGPQQFGLAGRWIDPARQNIDQGGFTSAVRADETSKLACIDSQAHSIERTESPEILGEVTHFQHHSCSIEAGAAGVLRVYVSWIRIALSSAERLSTDHLERRSRPR